MVVVVVVVVVVSNNRGSVYGAVIISNNAIERDKLVYLMNVEWLTVRPTQMTRVVSLPVAR